MPFDGEPCVAGQTCPGCSQRAGHKAHPVGLASRHQVPAREARIEAHRQANRRPWSSLQAPSAAALRSRSSGAEFTVPALFQRLCRLIVASAIPDRVDATTEPIECSRWPPLRVDGGLHHHRLNARPANRSRQAATMSASVKLASNRARLAAPRAARRSLRATSAANASASAPSSSATT